MKIITTLIGCATVMLYSCSPYYYSPNKGNVPNIRERNDIRLDAGLSGGFVMRGADVQFAYAPLAHVGVMVNGAFSKSVYETSDLSTKKTDTRSHYFEAGLGYFSKLEENKRWVFEMYAGAGKGDYKLWYRDDQSARVHMNKCFVQPSLSFTHPNRNIELSIGSRFSGVNHSLESYTLVDDSNHYDLWNLQHKVDQLSVYWEPSFRFSGGGSRVKGYVSCTPSIGMFNRNGAEREYVNISLGMRLTMNTSRKK
ncbi:hypothetical protein Dfri01_25800 [Dyadobacter frigoris]|uniref:hypothetical protein n=1 Tax=Dyadobacter frigoris TaxID=2576211 RepID=UPI0024A42CB0|nr:hypothetical protein [Dyadobacter frigoris]GLU53119.1 hypothetical protein Dfri01_25800 [Dyadobacter frigoris]